MSVSNKIKINLIFMCMSLIIMLNLGVNSKALNLGGSFKCQGDKKVILTEDTRISIYKDSASYLLVSSELQRLGGKDTELTYSGTGRSRMAICGYIDKSGRLILSIKQRGKVSYLADKDYVVYENSDEYKNGGFGSHSDLSQGGDDEKFKVDGTSVTAYFLSNGEMDERFVNINDASIAGKDVYIPANIYGNATFVKIHLAQPQKLSGTSSCKEQVCSADEFGKCSDKEHKHTLFKYNATNVTIDGGGDLVSDLAEFSRNNQIIGLYNTLKTVQTTLGGSDVAIDSAGVRVRASAGIAYLKDPAKALQEHIGADDGSNSSGIVKFAYKGKEYLICTGVLASKEKVAVHVNKEIEKGKSKTVREDIYFAVPIKVVSKTGEEINLESAPSCFSPAVANCAASTAKKDIVNVLNVVSFNVFSPSVQAETSIKELMPTNNFEKDVLMRSTIPMRLEYIMHPILGRTAVEADWAVEKLYPKLQAKIVPNSAGVGGYDFIVNAEFANFYKGYLNSSDMGLCELPKGRIIYGGLPMDYTLEYTEGVQTRTLECKPKSVVTARIELGVVDVIEPKMPRVGSTAAKNTYFSANGHPEDGFYTTENIIYSGKVYVGTGDSQKSMLKYKSLVDLNLSGVKEKPRAYLLDLRNNTVYKSMQDGTMTILNDLKTLNMWSDNLILTRVDLIDSDASKMKDGTKKVISEVDETEKTDNSEDTNSEDGSDNVSEGDVTSLSFGTINLDKKGLQNIALHADAYAEKQGIEIKQFDHIDVVSVSESLSGGKVGTGSSVYRDVLAYVAYISEGVKTEEDLLTYQLNLVNYTYKSESADLRYAYLYWNQDSYEIKTDSKSKKLSVKTNTAESSGSDLYTSKLVDYKAVILITRFEECFTYVTDPTVGGASKSQNDKAVDDSTQIESAEVYNSEQAKWMPTGRYVAFLNADTMFPFTGGSQEGKANFYYVNNTEYYTEPFFYVNGANGIEVPEKFTLESSDTSGNEFVKALRNKVDIIGTDELRFRMRFSEDYGCQIAINRGSLMQTDVLSWLNTADSEEFFFKRGISIDKVKDLLRVGNGINRGELNYLRIDEIRNDLSIERSKEQKGWIVVALTICGGAFIVFAFGLVIVYYIDIMLPINGVSLLNIITFGAMLPVVSKEEKDLVESSGEKGKCMTQLGMLVTSACALGIGVLLLNSVAILKFIYSVYYAIVSLF